MPDEPLPPDVLADALQDKAHREIGIVRPAKVRRLMPAEEARKIMAGLRAINEYFGYQWTQPLMRAEQDVAAALAKRDGVVEAARIVTGIPVTDSEDKARIDALLVALAELD